MVYMADSDDDSEHRKSRDKFRRERSDYDRRDKREPFDDRAAGAGGGGGYSNTRSRPDSRSERHGPSDYRSLGGVRDRTQQSNDIPSKRPRRDWNDDTRSSYRQRDTRTGPVDEEVNYRPPLMPFKRFLDPLDELITDEEAMNKYKEYKESFNKRYIEEFFESHKEEEWLREKYHPNYIDINQEKVCKNIRHRLDVFLDLFDKGMIDNQSVQMENSDKLTKLMDAVVIKLSGGTDEDLVILDEDEHESHNEMLSDHETFKIPDHENVRSDRLNCNKSEEGEDSDFDSDDGEERKNKSKVTPTPSCKTIDSRQSKNISQRAQSPNETVSNSESDGEDDKETKEDVLDTKVKMYDIQRSDNDEEEDDDNVVTSPKQIRSSEAEEIKHENAEKSKELEADGESVVPLEDEEDVPTPTTAEIPGGGSNDQQTEAESTVALAAAILGSPLQQSEQSQRTVANALDSKSLTPRNLHKTASVFFRGLPPTITRNELEELCSSQPGFLRLAMYDPMPERRFTRHAWATYKPDVNIKKICWALNTSSLLREKWHPDSSNTSSRSTTGGTSGNNELCATVNRDLAQRVRPVTPITRHKPAMRNDLIIASCLIAQLDGKHNLWPLSVMAEDEEKGEQVPVTTACPVPGLQDVFSANPLMRNLTDHLIDESGAEEAMLISGSGTNDEKMQKEDQVNVKPIETDAMLARALDRLLIYLRIVYSIDYYSATVYQLEDLMPHKCGIFHVRGDRGGINSSSNTRRDLTVSEREVAEYIETFNAKIAHLLESPPDLTNEEIAALGARDPEKAGEDFIEANIQKKTSKKKPFKVVWVCPLSDKKFREPIFVRKHILNKHMEKVEAAKLDNAVFFNNFLRDPRRASLPEAPRHMISHYYPPNGSSGTSGIGMHNHPSASGDRNIGGGGYGMRGRNNGGGGYRPGGFRGGYRNTNNFGSGGVNSGGYGGNRGGRGISDYYQDHSGGGGHQAMAAAAVAAAAALYPHTPAADLYALAAAGALGRSGGAGGNRGGSPREYQGRNYNNNNDGYINRKRPYPNARNDRPRPSVGSGRGVVSYNDLDDPGNDGY